MTAVLNPDHRLGKSRSESVEHDNESDAAEAAKSSTDVEFLLKHVPDTQESPSKCTRIVPTPAVGTELRMESTHRVLNLRELLLAITVSLSLQAASFCLEVRTQARTRAAAFPPNWQTNQANVFF